MSTWEEIMGDVPDLTTIRDAYVAGRVWTQNLVQMEDWSADRARAEFDRWFAKQQAALDEALALLGEEPDDLYAEGDE